MGPKTVASNLHCLCTHLSAFGGDFFVAPNPIDFDKVWAEFGNLAESGNFVVLVTVCSIFGLYFVGLVFARKADKKDEKKVSYSKCKDSLKPFNVGPDHGKGVFKWFIKTRQIFKYKTHFSGRG